MTAVLSLDDVKVWFGGVRAVDGVTLSVEPGRLYGLVGPNGSGKTTLINAISGLTRLTDGRIAFVGADVGGARPEIDGLLRGTTLLYLDELHLHDTGDATLLTRLLRRAFAAGVVVVATSNYEPGTLLPNPLWHHVAVDRLDLADLADQLPDGLPYGTQRRVEIARALASRPRLLLLDEPIAGMNQQERDEIAQIIRTLRDDGLTQILIEHDLRMILNTCDHLFVMNFGKCVAEGEPRATAALPVVQEAYLGKRDGDA